jgi:hypothetical protein
MHRSTSSVSISAHRQAARRVHTIVLMMMVTFVAQHAHAAFFNNLTGLPDPGTTITFDESGLPEGTQITNQFAGLTIDPYLYLLPFLQCNSCNGFSGDFVANIPPSNIPPFIQPITLQFDGVVSEAAFAIVDQNTTWTFEARLGATLVESASMVIPFSPGAGFVGFTGISFDRIVLKSPSMSAMGLDNLQFTRVPEPAGVGLALLGVGLMWVARRQPHKSFLSYDARENKR